MTTFCSYLPLPTCSISLSSQLVLAPSSQGDQVGQRALKSSPSPFPIDQNHLQKDAKALQVGTTSRAPPPWTLLPHQDVTSGTLCPGSLPEPKPLVKAGLTSRGGSEG